MNKKKYFIILAVFLFAGLGVYSFAGTEEETEFFENEKEDIFKSAVVEEKVNDTKETEEVKETEVIVEDESETKKTVKANTNVQTKDYYGIALKSVVASEKDYTNVEKYEDSVDAVKNVPTNDSRKIKLESRLDDVLAGLELLNEVKELIEEYKGIVDKADLIALRDKINGTSTGKAILDKINELSNTQLGQELKTLLAEIMPIISDFDAPVVNVEDGALLNEKLTLNVNDANGFKVYLISNDGEIEIENGYVFEDGTYKVLVIDTAFNSNTVEFTVDTKAPVYLSLRIIGGNYYNENSKHVRYAKVGTIVYVYTTFTEKLAVNPTVTMNGVKSVVSYLAKESTNQYIYASEFKLSEDDGLVDGQVSIKVFGYADEAGNVGVELTDDDITLGSQKYVVIDKTAPKVEAQFRPNTTNKITDIVASDANNIVFEIYKDGKRVHKVDQKVNSKRFSIDWLGDGEYKVVVTDAAGNVSEVTATIDHVAPEYATLRMLGGKVVKGNGTQTWYVKEGQTINVYMTFKEKLATNAKVRISGEELNTSYIKEVNGTYMYGTTYTVKKNSVQGPVSIEVYGYADKYLNVGETLTNNHITTPGQKNVTIDTMAATIEIPYTDGKNKNEMIVTAGTRVTLEDVMAVVTDNVDGVSKLAPYKANLLISNKPSENIYNYDFSNGFDTNYQGRYNLYYKYEDKAGNVVTAGMMIMIKDKTAPTYKFYKLGSSLPKDEIEPVVIDGVNYFDQPVRVVFTDNVYFKQYVHNDFVNNEDKITIKSWTREAKTTGEHTMSVKDAGGNKTEVSFVITDDPKLTLVFAFAKGGEFTLTEDTVLSQNVELKSGKSLEIDLNGHKLTLDNEEGNTSRLIDNNGNLIIKNGSLVNSDVDSTGMVVNNGTLNIDGVTVKDNGSYNNDTIINGSNGEVIITNSIIEQNATYGAFASDSKCKTRYCANAVVNSNGKLTIKDTTIKSNSQWAYTVNIYGGNANIENVVINSGRGGFGIDGGNVNLKNVDVTLANNTNAYYAVYTTGAANVSITGGTMYSKRQTLAIYGGANVTVNSGTFKTRGYKGSLTAIVSDSTLTIKGGMFAGYDASSYLASGYTQLSSGEVTLITE